MVVSFYVSGHISTQRLRKFFLAKEINPEDSGRALKGDDEDDIDDWNESSADDKQSLVEVSVLYCFITVFWFLQKTLLH